MVSIFYDYCLESFHEVSRVERVSCGGSRACHNNAMITLCVMPNNSWRAHSTDHISTINCMRYSHTNNSPPYCGFIFFFGMFPHLYVGRCFGLAGRPIALISQVLRRGRTERKSMNRIRAGQMSFLGHIMRKHRLENIVVTGKIEGERSRGRPRLNVMKSLSQLLKISEVEIIERTRNREEWRTMTGNVRIGYST